MRTIFLLALLPLVFALFEDDPELSLSVHNASPLDIRGIFLLQEATGDNADLCAQNITHTTWRRISDGSIGLPHNTIIQDGQRCESNDDDRSLRFYMGTDYDNDYVPISDADPLPEDFIRVMNSSGLNRGARRANRENGAKYLMGYEQAIRVCGGMGDFGIGTTAFLMRPTASDIVIDGLVTPLTPGLKYLLMVPRFRKTYCLYSSDVNGPDDNFRPIPSDELIPTIEPVPSDELETAGPLPSKPGRPPVTVTVEATPAPVAPTDEFGGFPGDTIEPSISPEESPGSLEDDDDGVCFPAEAAVLLEDGRRKRMDEIVVGDNVQVGPEKFSRVFSFTHKDSAVLREFVTLSTATAAISATVGHYIYINGLVSRIETARVGDKLTLSTGESAVIVTVSKGMKTGLYNPQTLHGDIIVDGIRATTYTRTVDPPLAHAVLAPVRALFKTCGADPVTWAVPQLRNIWLRLGRSL